MNIITACVTKTSEEKAEDAKFVIYLVGKINACIMCNAITSGGHRGNLVCIITIS